MRSGGIDAHALPRIPAPAHGRSVRAIGRRRVSDLGASRIPNPHYAATRFHLTALPDRWPSEFVIITAYAPTGQRWTDQQNETADHRPLPGIHWNRCSATHSVPSPKT